MRSDLSQVAVASCSIIEHTVGTPQKNIRDLARVLFLVLLFLLCLLFLLLFLFGIVYFRGSFFYLCFSGRVFTVAKLE